MRDHFDPLATCRWYEQGAAVGATTLTSAIQHNATYAATPPPATSAHHGDRRTPPGPTSLIVPHYPIKSAATGESTASLLPTPNRPNHQHGKAGSSFFTTMRNVGPTSSIDHSQSRPPQGGNNLKRPVSSLRNGPHEGGDGNDSDETNLLDCQSLQSSLKRVRLSCSPGELRLQRDLKMLPPLEWNVVKGEADAWVHLPTRARLTLVDSLRLCLFMPAATATVPTTTTAAEAAAMFSHPPTRPIRQNHLRFHPSSSTSSSSSVSNSSSTSHTSSCSHEWRIMIQIPRMYPHRPPVVSRMDGLWMEQVIVNEAPPTLPSLSSSSSSSMFDDGNVTDDSSMRIPLVPLPLLGDTFPTSAASRMSDNDDDNNNNNNQLNMLSSPRDMRHHQNQQYQVCGAGRTVVWNHWSPIISLGDLLDFLLSVVATTGPDTNAISNASYDRKNTMGVISQDGMLQQQTLSLSTSSSESSSSYVSSAGLASIHETCVFREEHKTADDHRRTTTSTTTVLKAWDTNPNNTNGGNSGLTTDQDDDHRFGKNGTRTGGAKDYVDSPAPALSSFLSPNRFDVGYEKYSYGFTPMKSFHQRVQTTAATIQQEEDEDDAMMMME